MKIRLPMFPLKNVIPYNTSIFCLPHLDPLSTLLHPVLCPRELFSMWYNYIPSSSGSLCLANGRLCQETGERRIKLRYLFLGNLPIVN